MAGVRGHLKVLLKYVMLHHLTETLQLEKDALRP